MGEGTTIHLKLPPERFFLGLIRHVVAELAAKIGFPSDQVAQIEMAVDEACTGIVERGKGRSAEFHGEDMELTFLARPDRIEIVVTHRGPALAFPETRVEEVLRGMDLGGLGIYVIQTLMDEVEYLPSASEGNRLRMVKRLTVS